MRTRLSIAVLAALAISGCALGDPKPTTLVTDTSATFNGDVYSSFAGDTEYWWRYGETTAYGSETPHRTIAIADDAPHAVSEPVAGLAPSTAYHLQMCVEDQEEDPPRVVCSTDRTFTTGPAGGRSGILFDSWRTPSLTTWVMDEDGTSQTQLTAGGPNEHASWSPDARRVAFMSNNGFGTGPDVWLMDPDGENEVNLTADHETPFISSEDFPAWSPDGQQIAFVTNRDADLESGLPDTQIYVMDTDGDNPTALTHTPDANNESPAWSPDGRKLCFFSNRDGDFDVYVMNRDGSNQVNLTNEHAQSDFECVWTRDGRRIVYRGANDLTRFKIMDADGGNKDVLASTGVVIAGPTFSPDGSRLAFYDFDGSNNFGSIYVSDADGTDKVELTTSSDKDYWPVWSPRPAPRP